MKKITAIAVLISIMVIGCTKDFEEINQNPNSPENIEPEFLLTNVISVSADNNTFDQGFRLANYLTQFAASVEFERIDRYEMGSNSTYWNTIYGLLNDLESIKTNPKTNDAYDAVSDIMRCYLYSQLTDMWGDIPYSEAIQAESKNFTPKYDTQEFIYTDSNIGLLKVLEDAAAILSATNSKIKGDVLFGNDLNSWVKFANSLRVRYTLRISNRITDFSKLQTLSTSADVMQSNADNAVLPYLSSAPNQFPMSFSSLGLYQEHRMTTTVDSVLTLWNDPRVNVLYKPTEASVLAGAPEFVGLQNGQSRETIASKGINLNDISLFGAIFRDVPNGIDAQFMQYAELQFAFAEAAERGLISGSAQQFYENGIRASFDYYNVVLPADYLTRPSIAYGTDNLNKILTQKWLMLNTNGHEAWFSIRRTGIPALTPGPDNFNNDRYPVRYLYPESEQATNSANVSEAAARMGGNNINAKGWWEKP